MLGSKTVRAFPITVRHPAAIISSKPLSVMLLSRPIVSSTSSGIASLVSVARIDAWGRGDNSQRVTCNGRADRLTGPHAIQQAHQILQGPACYSDGDGFPRRHHGVSLLNSQRGESRQTRYLTDKVIGFM